MHLWCAGRRGLAAVVTIVALVSCGPDVQEQPLNILQATNAVPKEYIVTATTGVDAAALRQLYDAYGIGEITNLSPHVFLMKLEKDPGLEEIKRIGVESGKIRNAQPNFRYRAQ